MSRGRGCETLSRCCFLAGLLKQYVSCSRATRVPVRDARSADEEKFAVFNPKTGLMEVRDHIWVNVGFERANECLADDKRALATHDKVTDDKQAEAAQQVLASFISFSPDAEFMQATSK